MSELIRLDDAIEAIKKRYVHEDERHMWRDHRNDTLDVLLKDFEAIPTIKPPQLSEDGTLEFEVADATKVGRVLIRDDKNWGGLYYADAEPKRGKWVTKERYEHYPSGLEYEADYCSVCGKRGNVEYNYCPNCGSDNRKRTDMRGEADIIACPIIDDDSWIYREERTE